ncbi:hypothetical protein BUALT_Bualt05G0029000 [Buddleja alternifolia]|uniref:Myb-like domain-containing protein n=1 Tax=Buddleja alternifolia TaxID=168488 RepID=A0AAV6XG71_9LAMI|nr:hypothetical protein BUALT_Bualt05G0029000 [Buddleja alternifolia]
MDEPKGPHRTRSKAAPDWTVEEALVLVNEINAVESEWGATLPSFQKWQQIVENCNALDVNRNLNQCKRKWEALLSDYRSAKHEEVAAIRSFPIELFKAVDRCVNAKHGGDEVATEEDEEEVVAAAEEEQAVMDTDPDSDPDAQGKVTNFFFETGTKKQRRRMKRQKRRLESLNPWGYFTSSKIKHEESSDVNENMANTKNNILESVSEENNVETKEQIMAKLLCENALKINSILEGNIGNDIDYKLADLKKSEAVQTDFTRRQGDKLIDCLGEISATLNQLCDLVQQCK